MNLSKLLFVLGAMLFGATLAPLQGCTDDRRMSEDSGVDMISDGGSQDAGVLDDAGLDPDGGLDMDDAGSDASTVSDAGPMCEDPYVGDLIRGDTTAVYYIGTDGKRYVFPADREFLTWFPDFSDVMMVSDAEVAATSIGGNARVRPGTHLVKIPTDPAVYAVTPCGILRQIESELLAEQLYGPDWASRVVDLPDMFFINYTLGEPVTTAVHPDGQLIRYAGDVNVYLMEDGGKRLVSSRAFADSGFRLEHAIETTITYPDGLPYDCAEPLYQEVVCVDCGCPSP